MSIGNKGWQAAVATMALAAWATALQAAPVNDMPGGPAVRQLNLQPAVTSIAAGQHFLHNVLLIVSAAIALGVFGVMLYSIIKHRKSVHPKPAEFHESTAVEITWTIVPLLIVIGLGVVATGEIVKQKDTSNPDLTVKVTGYQWRWGYDYLKGEGQGISFLSSLTTPREQINNLQPKSDTYLAEVDNPLVVPVNKKVRVITTANDVVHAWWVPAFGVKQDAYPGFVREIWFRAEKEGVYRGHCAELCGKEHAFMPIVVNVVSDADYTRWVEGKKKEMAANADDPTKTWTIDELKTRGAQVYTANCAVCHQANGQGVPGAFAKLDGSGVVNGPKGDNISVLLNGKNSGAFPSPMPGWKQLSDTEIAAVITYTRNSWANKPAENIVQPAEITAARK
jgi:cytochrome c oxidase subunit 2